MGRGGFGAHIASVAFFQRAWAQASIANDWANQQSPVERGQYLVGAANCVSCHTAKAGTPFAGGRAFRTTYGFFGDIYSSNITPDRDTGIGTWTEEEFIRAMRSGVAPGGRHLFPAFPYTSFTKLSTADIRAIYAYLRTIPATRSRASKKQFLVSATLGDAAVERTVLQRGRTHVGFESNLTRGMKVVISSRHWAHCGACHTPRNFMLAERRRGGVHGRRTTWTRSKQEKTGFGRHPI